MRSGSKPTAARGRVTPRSLSVRFLRDGAEAPAGHPSHDRLEVNPVEDQRAMDDLIGEIAVLKVGLGTEVRG